MRRGAEAVEDGDFVGVDEGKFEVGFEAAHDKAGGFGGHEVAPDFAVLRVDVHGEVGDPVYAGRFGVAVVVYVVDVLKAIHLPPRNPLPIQPPSSTRKEPLTPSKQSTPFLCQSSRNDCCARNLFVVAPEYQAFADAGTEV